MSSTPSFPPSAASSEDADTRTADETKFHSWGLEKQIDTLYTTLDRRGKALKEMAKSDKERQGLLYELQVQRQQFTAQMNAALERGLATIANDILAIKASQALLKTQLANLTAAVASIVPTDLSGGAVLGQNLQTEGAEAPTL